MHKLFSLLLVLIFQSIECVKPDRSVLATHLVDEQSVHASDVHTQYNFETPSVSFELQNRLREISGLTVIDDNTVAAIQDEDGKVYMIDMQDGKVKDDFRFEEKGDFEAIERVGDDLFVLRSDGTLFEIRSFLSKGRTTQKIKTPLKSRHDTEGLAYDTQHNRLLVLCKEFPGEGLKGKRAIYAFDLETYTLSEAPVYTLDLEEIAEFAVKEENAYLRFSRKLLSEGFNQGGFKPAALAIHPVSKHLFIVSSVEKLMLELRTDGTIEAAWSLPDKLFRQPEGLAFMPGGDLIVSNEGDGKDATLLRFESQ